MFRLRTFGGLTLTRDDVSKGESPSPANAGAGSQRRSLTLLAVLAAAAPGGLSRGKVMAILWPESDAESARRALRQAVFATRRELGSGKVILGTTDMVLNPELITSDVQEFMTAAAQGTPERAVELYSGPFLDGMHGRSSQRFERWVETQRARFAEQYCAALTELAKQATAGGDHGAAVGWWHKLTSVDPLSSRAAAGLMEALASAGDSAAALAHYRAYERVVREELASNPDATVIQVAQRIRGGADTTTTARAASNGVSGTEGVSVSAKTRQRRGQMESDELAESASLPSNAAPDSSPLKRALRPRFSRRTMGILGLTSIAAVGALAIALTNYFEPVAATRLVVVPFENRTGDSRLDVLGTLTAQWIIDGVSRIGLVNVVDPATAFFSARDARRERLSGSGDPSLARAIARATGASVVVTGDYYRKGDSLQFHGRVTDAATDRVLASMAPVTMSASSSMAGVETVRQRVSGLLAREFDARLSDIVDSMGVPPTLDAYREYAGGLESFMRRDYASAAKQFRRAHAVDTSFAAALIWAAHAYDNSGDTKAAGVLLDSLGPLRERLIPLDRYALDAMRANHAGHVDSAITAAKAAARLAPRSQWVWNAALWSMYSGRPRQAVSLLETVDPTRGWWKGWAQYWSLLASAKHMIRNTQGEWDAVERGLRQYPSAPAVRLAKVRSLIAQDRISEVYGEVNELLASEEQTMPTMISFAIDDLRLHGRISDADRVFALTLPWYRSTGHSTPGGQWGFGRILHRSERWGELRRHFGPIAQRSPESPVAIGYIGAAAAALGDTTSAVAIADSLSRFADNRPLATFWRAQIAYHLGRRGEATTLLRAAWDAGVPRTVTAHSPRDVFPRLKGYAPFEQLVGSDK